MQGPERAWLLFEYLSCLGFANLRFEPELDERAGCEQLPAEQQIHATSGRDLLINSRCQKNMQLPQTQRLSQKL